MNQNQATPRCYRILPFLILLISIFLAPAQAADRWNFPQHVSEDQRKVFEGWTPYWETPSGKMPGPDDYEGWLAKREEKNNTPVIKALNKKVVEDFKAKVEEAFMDGVRVLEITPEQVTNPDSIVIYSHPGGMYAQTADLLLIDAIPMAHDAKARFISVDYRKIPGPPKGLTISDQREDIINVYKYLVEKRGFSPSRVGMYGCSAGSTLLVAAVNKLSKDKYPLPGAIAPNAGVYDWATQGDTWYTLEGKDPIVSVPHYMVPLREMMKIDPKDPQFSPVYDDFKNREWPATMLFVGSREMLLSDSLNLNQRLKEADHDSEANVFDGVAHCWPSVFYSPEAAEMRRQFVRFMKEKGVLQAGAKHGEN